VGLLAVKIVVPNAGNADANAVEVSVWNPSTVATVQTFMVAGLAASASRTLYHSLPSDKTSCVDGGVLISATRAIVVDLHDAVVEWNEGNNNGIWSRFAADRPALAARTAATTAEVEWSTAGSAQASPSIGSAS
jgi:hypothetical protein